MKQSPAPFLFRSALALALSLSSLAAPACSSGGTTSTGSVLDVDGGAGDRTANADGGTPSGDAGAKGDGGGTTPTASGLEGFCEHYKECGGTYYKDVEACMKATLDYWTECRRPELDAFGDCMMGVSCNDFSPDAYNPANTVCAKQWSAVGAKQCK